MMPGEVQSDFMAHLQVYYHNKATGGSTWAKPEGFDGEIAAAPVPVAANKVKGTDWSEVTCSDSRKYYYNPQTQVRCQIGRAHV